MSASPPGPGCPRVLWGVAFAILVRGLPVDADGQIHLSIGDVLNAYTLLGGLATAGLFLFHGAVFVALKTSGAVRDDAHRFAVRLSLPVTVSGRRRSGFGRSSPTARTGPGWCSVSRWSRSWRP